MAAITRPFKRGPSPLVKFVLVMSMVITPELFEVNVCISLLPVRSDRLFALVKLIAADPTVPLTPVKVWLAALFPSNAQNVSS